MIIIIIIIIIIINDEERIHIKQIPTSWFFFPKSARLTNRAEKAIVLKLSKKQYRLAALKTLGNCNTEDRKGTRVS